jgi:hypothetical protein
MFPKMNSITCYLRLFLFRKPEKILILPRHRQNWCRFLSLNFSVENIRKAGSTFINKLLKVSHLDGT